jgi:predicted Zn-dependent protease
VLFIPVFPVGASRQFTQCSQCQASFAMPPEQVASQVAKIDAKENQRAIAMYNSLRASPANSITLNDLMQLYASMSEFDSAISAAADFPAALNSSEQCMTTLGRVYLAKNEHGAALQWFDAAAARNPQYAEAYYYKAAAHLTATPAEPQKAAAAARTARNAGFPNAEELLRQAEQKMQPTEK